jgi:hypothetical protein
MGVNEIAHRGVSYQTLYKPSVHSIWIHDAELNLYYERRIYPLEATEELDTDYHGIPTLSIVPSVTDDLCYALFTMRHDGTVKVRLFDASGKCVDDCFEGHLGTGMHRVTINTRDLANGPYFVVLESKSRARVAKFVVAR